MKLKVLHLPYSVASMAYNSVQILNKHEFVEAKGIVIAAHHTSTTEGLQILSPYEVNKNLKGIWQRVYYSIKILKLIQWADVLHWYWNESVLPFELDLKFIRLCNKPAVVEWLGSDIRIPEVEFTDNPYYEKYYKEEGHSYIVKDYISSYRVQKKFADLGFIPVTTQAMDRYLIEDVFPKPWFYLRQRILTDDFVPLFPDPVKSKPFLVHAPTDPKFKGTSYILDAIEKLKQKYDFDFQLINKLPRKDALNIMQHCDVFIDQIIGGGYGLAACEAMAMGKPVICFIKDSLIKDYPSEIPIVNANPDNITEKIEALILDAQLRNQIGIKSRSYIDKYHSEKVLANEMIKIYEQVIAENKKR